MDQPAPPALPPGTNLQLVETDFEQEGLPAVNPDVDPKNQEAAEDLTSPPTLSSTYPQRSNRRETLRYCDGGE